MSGKSWRTGGLRGSCRVDNGRDPNLIITGVGRGNPYSRPRYPGSMQITEAAWPKVCGFLSRRERLPGSCAIVVGGSGQKGYDRLTNAGASLIGVGIYLLWLIIKALRKYTRSAPVRKKKAENARTLGEVLKQHRVGCKMTREFVAESLGVSRQAVSKWERGLPTPA